MGTALFIFIIGAVLAAIVALSTSNSNMRKRIEAAPTAGLMPGVDLNQLDAQANSALMAADDWYTPPIRSWLLRRHSFLVPKRKLLLRLLIAPRRS